MNIKNKLLIFIVMFLSIVILTYSNANIDIDKLSIQDGDIIFQNSKSSQSKAIELATKSKYTHMGIIFKKYNGQYYVYEAVQPVKFTPLKEWIKRGNGSHFVIKRLKQPITILNKKDLKQEALKYLGKNYDIYFEFSDEKMYCSELVWKIYKNALNIEIGKIKKLKDFDLNSDIVKSLMQKRYKNHIPYNEDVISPQDIYESKNLELVTNG
jgi:hypothetical protein